MLLSGAYSTYTVILALGPSSKPTLPPQEALLFGGCLSPTDMRDKLAVLLLAFAAAAATLEAAVAVLLTALYGMG